MKTFFEIHFLKCAASFAAFVYAAHCLADKGGWHLIDNVDLLFHEAGHVVFSPFGWTLSVAGGSLLQVIIPLIFFGYFIRNQQPFSSSVMLYWAAISTANVSVYAGDAVFRRLPLITGDSEGHDWNNLLSHFGLLQSTKLISGIIFGAAVFFLLAGLMLSAYVTYKKWLEPPEQEPDSIIV